MDERELTQAQKDALSELKAGFDQTLSRTPDPAGKEPSPRRRFAGFAAAAAGLAVIGLIVWAVATPSDSGVTIDDAIASIADVAAETEAPPPDAYVYSRMRMSSTQPGAFGDVDVRTNGNDGQQFEVAQERETWLSATRTGLVRVVVDAPAFEGAPTPRVYKQRPFRQYRFADRRYSYAQVQAFAKDPAPLIAEIERAAAESQPARARELTHWRYLYEPLLATSPPLPSSVRAALIRGLEDVEGVRFDSDARDSKNREGEQLSIESDGIRSTLHFDPDNATLLESSTTIARRGAGPDPDSKPGTVLHRITLIAQRTVDALPNAG